MKLRHLIRLPIYAAAFAFGVCKGIGEGLYEYERRCAAARAVAEPYSISEEAAQLALDLPLSPFEVQAILDEGVPASSIRRCAGRARA